MKKFLLLLSFVLALANLKSQNYQISFAATGASTTLDSIKIENLTQHKSINIAGDDVLQLIASVGINKFSILNSQFKISPNPMSDYSNIQFDAPLAGNVTIEIFDITGRKIIQSNNYLKMGWQNFNVSGISSGVYSLQINSVAYSYSSKLISNYTGTSSPKISYQNQTDKSINEYKLSNNNRLKSSKSSFELPYHDGDILKLTATSGDLKTVSTLIPTQDQTVTFELIPCNDASGYDYAVVKIGTQFWMAENLNATDFQNGDLVDNITDSIQWNNSTSAAYCYYTNDENYSNTYGTLYNWYAATDTRNICPSSWHVPTDAEWTVLTDFLANDGGKMKDTDSTLWNSPNIGATNESGFSALPAGDRGLSGAFYDMGKYAMWWSASEKDASYAWSYNVYFNTANSSRSFLYKAWGFSIRCIKD